MLEIVVAGALAGIALYLIMGIFVVIQVHRGGLRRIDPLTESSGWAFRAIVTPGLITFWPIVRRRLRPLNIPEDGNQKFGAFFSSASLQNYQVLLVLLLTILCPIFICASLLVRDQPLPPQVLIAEHILPDPWVQPGVVYGRIFPSLPARVLLARDTQHRHGLLFDFDLGVSVPPAALYWSPDATEHHSLPEDAIFVGMIWGPANHWVQFPSNDMYKSGNWIVYSYLTQSTEIFALPSIQSREFS